MRALSAALAVAALALSLLATSFSPGHAATLALSSTDLTQKTRAYGSPLTCTLTAVSDTYVRQDEAGSSFGSETSVEINNSATATRRVLVEFDLSGCSPAILSDAIVHTATVRLTTTVPTASSRSYELRRATSPWTESTTWTTQPSVAATATSTVGIPALTGSDTTIEWLAGSDVQAFIAGTANNLGWRLADTAEDGGTEPASISFDSREAASDRPQLVITYAP